MVSMVSEEQREQYFEQGFFIADDAIEPDMLEQLVAAAERACATSVRTAPASASDPHHRIALNEVVLYLNWNPTSSSWDNPPPKQG